jgi:S1-C subfamily serine protease
MSNSKNSTGISKAALSVVNIIATNSSSSSGYRMRENQEIVGSGIIISDDGYIITNLHIIDRKKEINVELDDGQIRIASVVGYDQRSDLAVIKITSQESLAPIKLANSKNIRVGDEVFAIGNAFGLGKTFTSGIVSATGRDYGNPYLELIQTDAAINPGNSGGALLNHRGNLIGMNTKIFSKTGSYAGIGFALPSNKMIEVASEIIKYGSVQQSWIGDFRVKYTRFVLDNKLVFGLEILELKQEGPLFEDADIKPGAIIISINAKAASWENLTDALRNSFPGDEIFLEILQENKIIKKDLVTRAQGN